MGWGYRIALFCLLLVPATCGSQNAQSLAPLRLLTEPQYKTFYKVAACPLMDLPKSKAWRKAVPKVRTISIRSSFDSTQQPALFYDSKTRWEKPLLVVLHSWSADYQQQFSIPYGVWAVRNDWVFIHPDYRGPFTNPQATGSEAAVQDILDAVEYARTHARVDPSRIYLAGFSGGAMMTLTMVGRYPEIWAGAVAWVPVYDLVDWYQITRGAKHDYSGHIRSSCGGAPVAGTAAETDCRKRSPSSYLSNARGKEVQVYIGTGIRDGFVPPSQALHAFNTLADSADRFDSLTIVYIDRHERLPDALLQSDEDTLYTDAGITLLLRRQSANAVVSIFNGRHDVIYNAGLVWLSEQRR